MDSAPKVFGCELTRCYDHYSGNVMGFRVYIWGATSFSWEVQDWGRYAMHRERELTIEAAVANVEKTIREWAIEMNELLGLERRPGSFGRVKQAVK